MAQGNNQRNPQEDGMWLLIVFTIGGMILLSFAKEWWKYGRLSLYEHYTNAIVWLFEKLHLTWILPKSFIGINEHLYVYEKSEITLNEMDKMSMDLMPFFVVPLILLLGFIYLRNFSKKKSFNRTFTRESLIHDQKKRWPWLYPIADLSFDADVEKGEWAMAKRPLDYVKKYQLFDENLNIIEEKATVLLTNQVGRLFEGFDKMKDYERALFIIFAAHAEMSKESKKDAIKWISILSITHKNQDFSWVEEAYQKYGNTKKVQQVLKTHAYVNTVLLGMLEKARGVLPTSLFVWLKPKDRLLYLTLNNLSVSRKEGFIECAGALNHFYAEKTLGKPILRQFTENALNGIKIATSPANIKITDNNYYNLEVE